MNSKTEKWRGSVNILEGWDGWTLRTKTFCAQYWQVPITGGIEARAVLFQDGGQKEINCAFAAPFLAKKWCEEQGEKIRNGTFLTQEPKYQPKSEAEMTEQDKDKKIEELTRENERMLMLLKYWRGEHMRMYQAVTTQTHLLGSTCDLIEKHEKRSEQNSKWHATLSGDEQKVDP